MKPTDIESILEIDYSKSIIEQVHHEILGKYEIQLLIKREDYLHPIISGNKWRKLKYPLLDALDKGFDHLISMGGAWSNHLYALAFIGNKLNIKTTGFIRGKAEDYESPTIKDLKKFGMHIEYVSRTEFRHLRQFRRYNEQPGIDHKAYWIPEGGCCELALSGIKELRQELMDKADIITIACGTGTTLAGLLPRKNDHYQAIGFSALKSEAFLEKEIITLDNSKSVKDQQWRLIHDYHFGGFAKSDEKLSAFITDFEQQTNIPLEAIYTGKMLYGIFDLVKKGFFNCGATLLAIHTGGLQGKRSKA